VHFIFREMDLNHSVAVSTCDTKVFFLPIKFCVFMVVEMYFFFVVVELH
jgi:hypothetical protein